MLLGLCSFTRRCAGASLAALLLAQIADAAYTVECRGPFKGRHLQGDMLEGSLESVINRHAEWRAAYPPEARSSTEAMRDPRRANLCGALLAGSSFFVADMTSADFSAADVRRVDFRAATLVGASFSDADARDAKFIFANASEAHFNGADLRGAVFEFKPGESPDVLAIWNARNLEWLTYNRTPVSLLEIRESFKKIGRRDLERRLTFAIEHTKTSHAFRDGHWLEAAFRYIAWELPTRYDLEPGRALKALLVLVGAFVIPYWYALSPVRPRYIWRVLPRERIGGDGNEVHEPVVVSGLRRMRVALQLSLLSAFNIGWRDLSIGNWLARLQTKEYSLGTQGWVRSLAGLQSLVSVYLLAMWALTYFGRLFEG
jgi:hypothetical protein